MRKTLLFTALTIFLSGCVSSANISEDLSPAELIQRAQEASDRNRYNTALQYYEALYERNLTNLDLVITAEYEIAFIHYKQKKYSQARDGFISLLNYYKTPDQELLPQHYKILSEKVLQKIEEKESDQRRKIFPWQKET